MEFTTIQLIHIHSANTAPWWILFFLFTNMSFSNEPVAYIDIDFILKNSDIGKKSLEKINTQNSKNIQDLKKKEKILKDL